MFEWKHLRRSLRALGVEAEQELFEALRERYTEPGRHYHTDRHVAECLLRLQRVRRLAMRPAEIEVALWFHDAVYDTRRGDNEAESAEWARAVLSGGGAEPDVVGRITGMILATRDHDAQEPDGMLLTDIDLGILGAPESVFEAYDRAIRAEYAWVPEDRYRAGRVQVLRRFLERAELYRTAPFRDRYETTARGNLARKIAELTG